LTPFASHPTAQELELGQGENQGNGVEKRETGGRKGTHGRRLKNLKKTESCGGLKKRQGKVDLREKKKNWRGGKGGQRETSRDAGSWGSWNSLGNHFVYGKGPWKGGGPPIVGTVSVNPYLSSSRYHHKRRWGSGRG